MQVSDVNHQLCFKLLVEDKLIIVSKKGYFLYFVVLAQLLEGRLTLNPGFLFWRSKAFSGVIFSVIFRASNHQLVDKKN